MEVGRVTPATIGDHIIPVKERPDLAFDFDNVMPLCETCHNSVKKREEATGHRAGTKTDGSPVDPGHFWNK